MPKYKPRKLTEGFIRDLPMNGTTYDVRDTKVVGLMLAVSKKAKSYKVQRDLWRGQRGRRQLVKTVRVTLGTTDELTLDAARLKAEDVIRQVKLGIDPNAPPATPKRSGWTVGITIDEYASDQRQRDCAPRTSIDALWHRDRYLAEWKDLPLSELTRSMVRARHKEISEKHGKVVANQVMRTLRAAYNLALRIADDPDALPDNPVKAVTFNKEKRRDAVIMPDDLAAWWQKVQKLPTPLRRLMQELGLYSGLRPGTLMSLRRDWVKLDQRTISIPRMKSGRRFDLPLSQHMIGIVERALVLSDMLYPNAEWLFPSRATKDDPKRGHKKGQVIATAVIREKSLPSETGHILRHTYRTIAQRINLDQIEARMLLDHTVPGIEGTYVHQTALFDRLLVAQERMSTEIMRLLLQQRPTAANDAQAPNRVQPPSSGQPAATI